MPKKETQDLERFLAPYPGRVQEIALWLREFIWDLYPDCNELIYDNYNAVAFGLSPSDRAGDVFVSIAVSSNHVNFGFNRGSALHDPEKILLGKGSLYRFIRVKTQDDFLKTYMKKLLKEAHANSMMRLKEKKQVLKGKTIVKSISPVKKRPDKNGKRVITGKKKTKSRK